jgi:hypothetical protein
MTREFRTKRSHVLIPVLLLSVASPLVPAGAGADGGAAGNDGDPVSITQNLDPDTIVDGTSFGCLAYPMVEHGWWRVFDLDGDHHLVGEFCVEDVDYAVQRAIGPIQNITAHVYCLDHGLPFVSEMLDEAGVNAVPQPDAYLEFFNVTLPPGTCCNADTQDLVVELRTDDCQVTGTCLEMWIGMNNLGQAAPTYVTSPACGLIEPADAAGLGFPNAHLIMVVNGLGSPQGDGGGVPDVPATTGVGLVVLALMLAGGVLLQCRNQRG